MKESGYQTVDKSTYEYIKWYRFVYCILNNLSFHNFKGRESLFILLSSLALD